MSEDMLHHIIRWHVCFAVRRASAVAPRDLPGLSAVERREEVSGFGSLVLPLPQTRAAGKGNRARPVFFFPRAGGRGSL
jgi:hypothetical protein